MAAGLESNTAVTASDMSELKEAIGVDKIKQAETLKNEGNIYYKQKDYTKALRCYHKAHLYAKGAQFDFHPPTLTDQPPPKISPETDISLQNVRLSLYNNIAACLLLRSPTLYERVLENCEESLKIDEDNVKAWYRKAQALLGLKKTREAKAAVIRANRLSDSKDSAIRNLLVTIDSELKSESDQFDDLFKDKFKKKLC